MPLFSLKASSKDTGQLFAAIHHRILALRSHVEQEAETKCPEPVREVAQCNEEDSDDDVLTPAVTATVGKYTCTGEARAIFLFIKLWCKDLFFPSKFKFLLI